MSVRRTREDFSSARLRQSCSLFFPVFLLLSVSVSRSFFFSVSLPLCVDIHGTRYTKCTVHACSTFASSSLLFLLFHLLLLLFLRLMAFLHYQPRLAARGATAKRKRTTNHARTCVSRDFARARPDPNGTMKIFLFARCLPSSTRLSAAQVQY